MSLFDWFLKQPDVKTPDTHSVNLAAAVLLVEIMRADHDLDEQEKSCIKRLLGELFSLPQPEQEALLTEAEAHALQANDLHQFTRVIHEQFSPQQTFDLLVGLWSVAFVNDGLDKYEEYMIRKIADLLHVPHSEFIRAKIQASSSN